MIHPDNRSLLTDALTPPPGYSFSGGIISTYSLDLVTLLTLPLHLSWLATADDGPDNIDPLRILESMRRTAEKITIFCERGRMLIPRTTSPLLSLLEDMVHETTAPHGGAFHPKVWLLRFAAENDSHDVVMRLLVMSRNLTDDASWDLCVQLEGAPGKSNKAVNKPLGQFVEQLIARSAKPFSTERDANMQLLLEDVRTCNWNLPANFDDVHFHLLGMGKQPGKWIPEADSGIWDELGVISPFVTDSALAALAETSKKPLFLISRSEEIDKLSSALPFELCWVLQEGIEEESVDASYLEKLTGLHAKAYIGKRGSNTHIFIGSANATHAALIKGSNVEFMVELIGKHSKIGKPEDWYTEKRDGLSDMLLAYTPQPENAAKTSNAAEILESVRKSISQCTLIIECKEAAKDWQLFLQGLHIQLPDKVTLKAWPLSLKPDSGTDITSSTDGSPACIATVTALDVTSFTGFSLVLNDEELSFGLDIPLKNPPAGRDADIMRLIIRNREAFVRYIMLLLGELLGNNEGDVVDTGGTASWAAQAQSDEPPLFELLATTYARNPGQLKHVASAIMRLQETTNDDGERVIPPEFLQIWQSFEEAMAKELQP